MDMGSIARSMRARMPWPVGQKVLRELDLPRGRGWDKTVEQLSNPESDFGAKLEDCAQALKEHLWCGEKLVRFYTVDRKTKDVVANGLIKASVPNTDYQKQYPLLLDEGKLGYENASPKLIAVEETADGVSAVFASVRAIMLREPLSKEELPEDALAFLDGYDEIVGVRHIRHQAIDVISVPKTGTHINVRIDYPEGMHRDVGEVAQGQARKQLAQLIKTDALTEPVNLFPLINAMYGARNEGIVVELAFGTTTASWKHEKMRRRASCLREEAYHKGGKLALKAPIEPYRLSIIWKRKLASVESKPELNLHSSSLAAGILSFA